jgi:predicted transcriptional regulator of viral defense system
VFFYEKQFNDRKNCRNISDPDLVTISKIVPKGVFCLISALYFHNLTNQIPHCIHIAIPQHIKAPKIDYPPAQFYWFSKWIWEAGIEEHFIGEIKIKVYSREKTIIDCFKHRNKIGIEVAIEALRTYWESGNRDLGKIQQFARISKVEKTIKPYLETIINI